MKYLKYANRLMLCVLMISTPMVGCDTTELHDLNINPQAVNQIDVNFMFSAAQLGSAAGGGTSGDNRYTDWRTNIGLCGYAIQQLATVSGGISPGDKYTDNQESYQAPWDFFYGDVLKNLAEVIKQTGEGGYDEGKKQNTRNAARIMRAFTFHRLTDYYGNIPYFEASQGIEGIFKPSYDAQSAIYADILKELDDAASALTVKPDADPDEGFKAADLIYDGDVVKWKKWAYSLMLRCAMRVSNVDATMAATYVTKAITGGVFSGNEDNAIVPMAETPSLWTNQNGISRAFIAADGGQPTILAKTLIDMLKGANAGSTSDDDPRLMIISGGVNGDTDPLAQEGMPNGLDQGTLDAYTSVPNTNGATTFSLINTLLLDRDEPYMLMNYAEVELLMAEAVERSIGSVTGTAQSHYEAGVKAAMQMMSVYDASFVVSDGAVSAYLANYPYSGTPDQKLEMIGNQMWISKFFNWWDAWADWRRTGYPVLVPINYPGNVTGGQIPTKLRLPGHEIATNEVNYLAGRTTPDDPTGKVWWDGGN
jgi:Starch-binding associating with outer membrane